ncbi:hypothetical protein NQ317_012470 [Molorchus minor]|uniref:Gustatory receptor n=1 Tax=Molorchus minor TaxID=1323400 RepID=A0ABQ9JBH8_9CUCU|nr:hypothetical protein NQ317_012470 [Molorchus minor]
MENKCWQSNTFFLFMNILVWLLLAIEVYYNYSDLYLLLSTTLIDHINLYMLMTTVSLINSYGKAIKVSIVDIRSKLQQEIQLMTKLKEMEKDTSKMFHKFRILTKVDHVLYSMVDIFKSIEALNSIYGFQILGLASIIMLFITDMFNTAVSLEDLVNEIVVGKCYCSLVLVILGISVVVPCFEATNELDEIIKVACKFLIELPPGYEEPSCKLLKHKLFLFSKATGIQKTLFLGRWFF